MIKCMRENKNAMGSDSFCFGKRGNEVNLCVSDGTRLGFLWASRNDLPYLLHLVQEILLSVQEEIMERHELLAHLLLVRQP